MDVAKNLVPTASVPRGEHAQIIRLWAATPKVCIPLDRLLGGVGISFSF
jgi:hypothetical protein